MYSVTPTDWTRPTEMSTPVGTSPTVDLRCSGEDIPVEPLGRDTDSVHRPCISRTLFKKNLLTKRLVFHFKDSLS